MIKSIRSCIAVHVNMIYTSHVFRRSRNIMATDPNKRFHVDEKSGVLRVQSADANCLRADAVVKISVAFLAAFARSVIIGCVSPRRAPGWRNAPSISSVDTSSSGPTTSFTALHDSCRIP